MNATRFEWDPQKDRSNRRKHGVSFEEARAFLESGVDYLELFDASHSEVEDRFLAIGPTPRGLVIVAWTLREDDAIRIISARFANHREARLFRERIGGWHE